MGTVWGAQGSEDDVVKASLRSRVTRNPLNNTPSKIALVTGANKGIGLETARQLARDHGFTVLLGARDEKRGHDAANELQAAGLDAHFLFLDPTNAASVERVLRRFESGKIQREGAGRLRERPGKRVQRHAHSLYSWRSLRWQDDGLLQALRNA